MTMAAEKEGTKTIDLDLVELRCKLRGWQCFRQREGERLHVTSPIGVTATIFNGVWKWGGEDVGDVSIGDFRQILTAPRLTLAAIIADPGEGWTATSEYEGRGAMFHRRNASGHILALIGWLGGKVTNDWCAISHIYRQPMKIAERINCHRAVTDLLVKLAEVQP